jgi:hypothetical protein
MTWILNNLQAVLATIQVLFLIVALVFALQLLDRLIGRDRREGDQR